MTSKKVGAMQLRILPVLFVTLGLLLIPLIAMQLSEEVRWGPLDFAVMGILIFGTGLLIDIALRRAGKYRLGAVLGIIVIFLWIWAELAVGVFTNIGS